jgi:hypothetical protein
MTATATKHSPGSSAFGAAAPQRQTPAAAAVRLFDAAGPRKPLHLDGRAHPIEVGTAGPALAVARGAQRMQFPLARLSRVLVRGRVRWDGEALALCLRQRVPVVFLDSRAQPIGAALALQAQPGALDELLSDFVERPDWRICYENWLRSQRLTILLRWRRQRAALGQPLARTEWNDAVRTNVYVPQFAVPGPEAGAAYGLSLAVLARVGVRSQYRAFDGDVLALGADLGRLLDLFICTQAGTLSNHFDGHERLRARAFEARAAEHEAFVLTLLGRLRRRLGEWIEPWP